MIFIIIVRVWCRDDRPPPSLGALFLHIPASRGDNEFLSLISEQNGMGVATYYSGY